MNPSYLLLQNLHGEITIPEKGILSHTVYNDDNLKIILFGFAPGQELTAHTAPMPATMMFLEGEADLTLGPERRAECFTPEALRRLDALRGRHEPDERFFTWP